MKAYGVVTKGNGEAWITDEKHMSLSTGGGQAGQGYPAVLIVAEHSTAEQSTAEQKRNGYGGELGGRAEHKRSGNSRAVESRG